MPSERTILATAQMHLRVIKAYEMYDQVAQRATIARLIPRSNLISKNI